VTTASHATAMKNKMSFV